MKKHLGSSAMVLAMFAAAVVACGDEGAGEKTQETKSAITARGFKAAGCSGAGIFDITSNNSINYVALDNSSFSDLNAEIFSLDKNNQEQFLSNTQSSNQIDESMTSLLDQVSNFTSASQRAEQIAAQQASSYNKATSVTTLDSTETASTANTASSVRDVSHRNFSRTSASGFNNTRSSRDVNSWANSANEASAWNSADSAQSAAAAQGSANRADSASNNAASNSASNSANSAATNSASNYGNAFNVVANGADGKAGWGKGGFGFFDTSNLSSFGNNVFSDVRASQFDSRRSDVNSSQFAKVADNQFAKSFQNSRQSAWNNTNTANRASSQANLHEDNSTKNAYDRSDSIANESSSHDAVYTANSATTRNDLSRRTATSSLDTLDSASKIASQNAANNTAANESKNIAKSQAKAQRYSALSNLSQFNSNHLVLKLNVTSNSESAIVRVFTGNTANNVAANQDFSQSFAGCGVSASVVSPKILPVTAPADAPAAVPAEAIQLGDRVAKPE